MQRAIAKKVIVLFGCGLLFGTPLRILGAGVTVITHGLLGSASDWVYSMCSAVPDYPNYLGSNRLVYGLFVKIQNGGLTVSPSKLAGGSFTENSSGEIIIALDWSPVADGFSFDTAEIAAAVAPALLDRDLIPELNGHALGELPLHLIGHSRGGSLMCEISRLLGENGVWVDHLTTLDPHPLNNDGFFDLPFLAVDAPAKTYENVLFHDNYYQTTGIAFGESVAGAYIRNLGTLDGGYSSGHSDVHLWYHGTIDFSIPASDSEAVVTSAERRNWWTEDERFGVFAGFYYSSLGGGNRISTNQPAGSSTSQIREGYNQWWNFGAGTSNNRTVIDPKRFDWPNIIRINLTGSNVVVQGQSNSFRAYIQAAQSSAGSADPALEVYLDDDFNPLNGNERLLKQIALTRNPDHQIGLGNADFIVASTNSTWGTHAVFGKISGAGMTRFLYAPELLTVISSAQRPELIMLINNEVPRLDLKGVTGQRVVIESSPDLFGWQPIATNWLSSPAASFSISSTIETVAFYRAVVR